jgi:glycosyltransferase involved in cell wall biosynthesis
MATVCDTFPIYSQTFVYQELTQLARNGFELRLVYSKLDKRDYLPARFDQLWRNKRCLLLNHNVHEKDFARYQSRMPEKVDKLIQRLCEASGLARFDLLHHGNFLQAFSFTRMVEAYRPDYLHSYFFYDRSLMALVAGYLLDIPRGISCYADHLLKDYDLKVVPLHLELCDIVIATSERIKHELLGIAPQVDPNRILVKPNGIDPECFPIFERAEPVEGEPFHLVSVCRIEPKKGIIDLVEAVSLLRLRGLNVEAHIVGSVDEWSQASREYKRMLDQRISELNLWGKVHLEGRQNFQGVVRFLGLAHLFVAPFVETDLGDKDGIPTALLEAMATSLPAVTTDAGSITEVIKDGRGGVVVPQRSPTALANAVEALLRDPQWRAQLGQEAVQLVHGRYDTRHCEKIFHERLQSICGELTSVNKSTERCMGAAN